MAAELMAECRHAAVRLAGCRGRRNSVADLRPLERGDDVIEHGADDAAGTRQHRLLLGRGIADEVAGAGAEMGQPAQ
jgi:hypothetical protein